jgi:hypothetical protein
MTSKICNSCSTPLELGSIATASPEEWAYWVKGQRDESDLARPGSHRGVKRIYIQSLRCPQCGRLELYAPGR